MEVTLNPQQKQFVINSGSSYTCLGFDVVFQQATELARRLVAAGKALVAEPAKAERGTLKQYEEYRALLDAYRELGDKSTWFDGRTPKKVQQVLEQYRKSGDRLRVFYGDETTGRDWMEEFDTVGTVGRSTGPMKVPLLIADGEGGGPALLTQCIVRMLDAETGKELYRHRKYHLPEIELCPAPADMQERGYTHSTRVLSKEGKFETHANFTSQGKAAHWVAFMHGECNAPPQ